MFSGPNQNNDVKYIDSAGELNKWVKSAIRVYISLEGLKHTDNLSKLAFMQWQINICAQPVEEPDLKINPYTQSFQHALGWIELAFYEKVMKHCKKTNRNEINHNDISKFVEYLNKHSGHHQSRLLAILLREAYKNIAQDNFPPQGHDTQLKGYVTIQDSLDSIVAPKKNRSEYHKFISSLSITNSDLDLDEVERLADKIQSGDLDANRRLEQIKLLQQKADNIKYIYLCIKEIKKGAKDTHIDDINKLIELFGRLEKPYGKRHIDDNRSEQYHSLTASLETMIMAIETRFMDQCEKLAPSKHASKFRKTAPEILNSKQNGHHYTRLLGLLLKEIYTNLDDIMAPEIRAWHEHSNRETLKAMVKPIEQPDKRKFLGTSILYEALSESPLYSPSNATEQKRQQDI